MNPMLRTLVHLSSQGSPREKVQGSKGLVQAAGLLCRANLRGWHAVGLHAACLSCSRGAQAYSSSVQAAKQCPAAQEALGSPMQAVLVLHSGLPVVVGMAIALIELQHLVVVGHCSPVLAQLGQAVPSVVVQAHLHMQISVRCSMRRPLWQATDTRRRCIGSRRRTRPHMQALTQTQCREQHPSSTQSGQWMHHLTVHPRSRWCR